jgi:hypothetical protein
MSAVKAAPFDPPALAARFEMAARSSGFRVERFGEIDGCPLLALTKRTAGVRPRIYLSSGIHGDEPAPPLALLAMLESGAFDARATWFICPLLNPSGFTHSVRENADGVDLNRDYKDLRSAEIRAHAAWLTRQPNFDLTLCLHEDWESKGFYLYELNPTGRPTLAEAMVGAAATLMPIEPVGLIDGREMTVPGIIRPVSDPLEREQWPEAIYLRAHHTSLGYTLETPSNQPLPQRIGTMRAAVAAAIGGLTAEFKSSA